MKTSESTELISAAVVKMHAEIENIKADSENPHFRSKYIDLSSIRIAIKGPLKNNDLAIIQLPSTLDGAPALTTRIIHKSGQWYEDTCPLLIEKTTMQGFGSAMTYMKRYSLGAATGIAEADDDGNEATKYGKSSPKISPPSVAPRSATTPASEAQRKMIFASSKELGLDETALKEFLFMVTEKSTSKEWSSADIDKILKAMVDFKKGKPVNTQGNFDDIQY